jgi:hypothetical protein
LFFIKEKMQKSYYNPKFISGQPPSTSGGGGGTGDIVLDDVENVQVDKLAVFSTVGAKRLKTTSTSLADLAQATDLLTKSGGNIVGNSTSGTSIASAVNNVILGTSCATSLTSGTDNVVIGSLSAQNLTASQNICIGRVAGVNLTSGENNICVGVGSGGGGSVSTTNSVFLGRDAVGSNNTNQTAIGFNARATTDNEMVLGGNAITHIRNSGVATCDLGTSTNPFKNLYITGGLQTSSSATASSVTSNIDFYNLSVADMRASITALGGTNRCYGKTAQYKAGSNLLAGRLVALQDQSTDTNIDLRVVYCQTGSETSASVCPIGITQGDALTGEKVTVCIEGYTSCIMQNSDSSPERGSQVMYDANDGRLLSNSTGGSDEGRVGFMAQSDSFSANDPALIFIRCWFQPY